MSKVVKYTCRLRRYDNTHEQLNTRYFIIISKEFFEGEGAQNLTLSPVPVTLATPLRTVTHVPLLSTFKGYFLVISF